MESKYTNEMRKLIVNDIMTNVLHTEEGQRWCEEYGVSHIPQQGFVLEDYHEEPIPFDMDRAVDILLQEYDDERTDFVCDDIAYGDMYTMFCVFQDIVFGTCWIF